MPDENKLAALADAGFSIRASCALCIYFNAGVIPDWGTCSRTFYVHKKHSGPARECSVPSIGWCKRFEKDEERLTMLGGAHIQFYDEASS